MNDTARTLATILGLQAAVIAAGIHLWWALPRLVAYLRVGSATDPRPYLFTVSALVLVGVVAALLRGFPPRRLYALGIGVMLTWALGYAWWHLTGHGGLMPGHHATDPVATVGAHLLDDPLAFVSMVAEIVGIASFAFLFATSAGMSPGDADADTQADGHGDSEADADFTPDVDG